LAAAGEEARSGAEVQRAGIVAHAFFRAVCLHSCKHCGEQVVDMSVNAARERARATEISDRSGSPASNPLLEPGYTPFSTDK
jgi:hypothetical protein